MTHSPLLKISEWAIKRPIGTTLLAIGLLFLGIIAYVRLPVAGLPTVEIPTITVSAGLPGADPATMARTVAAPLERQLGKIAAITDMSSTSSVGSTRIILQFDLDRSIDGAARDVQAAINAALPELPAELPSAPAFHKTNPNSTPILILALTSKTLPVAAVYDAADTIMVPRIARVPGVGGVGISDAEKPSIRVRVNPLALNARGVSLEEVRKSIVNANALGAIGAFDGESVTTAIGTNSQLLTVGEYKRVVVKKQNGAVVYLSDVARVEREQRNSRSMASFNKEPAVLLFIFKQPNANAIEATDHVLAILPELRSRIPAGIDLAQLADSTRLIRASIFHMQLSLAASVALVVLVIFFFLRSGAATIAASVIIPLSLAGTFAAMWLAGFSINNLSLLALVVAVGFIVDDAIVMVENVCRNLEKGVPAPEAALQGARQIAFTVVVISVALVAAFVPLMFLGGIVGRFFREFALTLVSAVVISLALSLTVAPMVCAHFSRSASYRPSSRVNQIIDRVLGALIIGYDRSLSVVLRHRVITLTIFLAISALTVDLYGKIAKSLIPPNESDIIFGIVEGSVDMSYQAMIGLQQRAAEIVMSDPAVAGVASTLGGLFGSSVNNGRLFINLKPSAERGVTANQLVDRLRPKLAMPGVQVLLYPLQDLQISGAQIRSRYQLSLLGPDFDELQAWAPRVLERFRQIPGLANVATDRVQRGLQLNISVDRVAAARLGVKINEISHALNDAFSLRQISTIFARRNQYRVVLDLGPEFQRDPSDLDRIYVKGAHRTMVPLSAIARYERGTAPLVVNHQGQFPAVAITYDLASEMSADSANREIARSIAALQLPDTMHMEPTGEARALAQTVTAQPLLLLAAVITLYLVLGVLYESLVHPLTILSTLPSAGLGALIALFALNMDLSLIAFVGLMLLIGVVLKNGIMLVNFALEGQRVRGLSAAQAIHEACLFRFRAIVMTTLTALFGAVPLLLISGPGSELRQPLAVTIIGGLLASQVLTLYTTPVIYLGLDQLHGWRRGNKGQQSQSAG